MKTSELIRLLQREDPSGEEHVVVGNIDIHFVELAPAYYDGSAQELIRDPAKAPYYNIVGGKYRRQGNKVQIHTLSITDVICDDPKATVDYSELPDYKRDVTMKAHNELRAFIEDMNNKSEREFFTSWAKVKANALTEDLEDIVSVAHSFFEKNLKRSDFLPNDPPNGSYCERRELQWDRELEVFLEDGFLSIRRKSGESSRPEQSKVEN